MLLFDKYDPSRILIKKKLFSFKTADYSAVSM